MSRLKEEVHACRELQQIPASSQRLYAYVDCQAIALIDSAFTAMVCL